MLFDWRYDKIGQHRLSFDATASQRREDEGRSNGEMHAIFTSELSRQFRTFPARSNMGLRSVSRLRETKPTKAASSRRGVRAG